MNFFIKEKEQVIKARYKPDLNELLSQCELNYCLMIQICPSLNKAVVDKKNITKSELTIASELVSLEFDITDIAKYTTTMKVLIKSSKIKMNNGIELIVRMYHDAKMLEVMEGSGPSTLKAIYSPVLNNIKPVDEKRQINRFVGECLRAVTAA